jgi:alpha-tubulin suppressor-like RCC1 family protein
MPKVSTVLKGSGFIFIEPFYSAWAWGRGTGGALGNLDTASKSSPVEVVGSHNFISFHPSEEFTVALKANGEAWAWGTGSGGRLGIYTDNNNRSSPVKVAGNHSFIKLTTGGDNTTTALKANGEVWSWGYAVDGALGNGDIFNKSSPVQAVGSHSFADIFKRGSRVFALKADGSLWAWGSNLSGQLGVGNLSLITSPTQVIGGHSFIQISVGKYFTIALKADGSAWSWGSNTSGQLGVGDTSDRSSPAQVVGGHSFIKVVAHQHGGDFSAALKADGTLWTWGYNGQGQLALNNSTSMSSPTLAVGGHSFVNVQLGLSKMFAHKANGSLWGAGSNISGALGVGSGITPVLSFTEVVGAHSFANYTINVNSLIALKANGEAWSWGADSGFGETGTSLAGTRSSPTQVVGAHSFSSLFVDQYRVFARKLV